MVELVFRLLGHKLGLVDIITIIFGREGCCTKL